jgi:cellulose synthase/poly-beta-1,6-N-acetylglucosamine synthase-like glycosyltransferase
MAKMAEGLVALALMLVTDLARAETEPALGITSWTDVGGEALFWAGGQVLLSLIVLVLTVYSIRHYCFTLQRLFGAQQHLHSGLQYAEWPNVVVFVAAHNEESVIADALSALLKVDYPPDRIRIMPVNDRSTDQTRVIVDKFAQAHPGKIQPFHRTEGKPGKAAALKDATDLVLRENWAELILVFDADYRPSRGLIKKLVAPFQDVEVGAVMGRVVPENSNHSLLTLLLNLERSGGYQVDQQARTNIAAVAQYGGTVGGMRLSALHEAGGWHDDVLAEDTDITFRLLLKGWKTVYVNNAECYEEVPQSWPVRSRQIGRWAKGHNQALFRHIRQLVQHKELRPMEKWDGLALLAIYVMPLMLVLGWGLALLLFYGNQGVALQGSLAVMLVLTYAAFGNFSAFYQIAAASTLDGERKAVRMLPLVIVGFLVSMVSISKATIDLMVLDWLSKSEFRWDKTTRYRERGVLELASQPWDLDPEEEATLMPVLKEERAVA